MPASSSSSKKSGSKKGSSAANKDNDVVVDPVALIRDESKTEVLPPRNILTGYYDQRGGRLKHPICPDALQMPKNACKLLQQMTKDSGIATDIPSKFDLPSLDFVLRPSIDPNLPNLTVTQLETIKIEVPAEPAVDPSLAASLGPGESLPPPRTVKVLRCKAENRTIRRIPKTNPPGTERIRGGGVGGNGGDDVEQPQEEQQQQQQPPPSTTTYNPPPPPPLQVGSESSVADQHAKTEAVEPKQESMPLISQPESSEASLKQPEISDKPTAMDVDQSPGSRQRTDLVDTSFKSNDIIANNTAQLASSTQVPLSTPVPADPTPPSAPVSTTIPGQHTDPIDASFKLNDTIANNTAQLASSTQVPSSTPVPADPAPPSVPVSTTVPIPHSASTISPAAIPSVQVPIPSVPTSASNPTEEKQEEKQSNANQTLQAAPSTTTATTTQVRSRGKVLSFATSSNEAPKMVPPTVDSTAQPPAVTAAQSKPSAEATLAGDSKNEANAVKEEEEAKEESKDDEKGKKEDKPVPPAQALSSKPDPEWESFQPGPNDETVTPKDQLPPRPDWYKKDAIHDIERTMLPEWFNSSAPHRTPDSYLKAREKVVEMSDTIANRNVTNSMIRRGVVGDAGSLQRLRTFLVHWGVINEDAFNDSAPTPASLRPELKRPKEFDDAMKSDLILAVVQQAKRRKVNPDGEDHDMGVSSAASPSVVPIDWEEVANTVGQGASAEECQKNFMMASLKDEPSPAERPITPDASHEAAKDSVETTAACQGRACR